MRKTAIKKDKRTHLQKNLQQTVLKLYRKKPIDAININEVCAKVGIPRSSFYYHYNTIRDILEEIEKDFIKQLTEVFEESDKTGLEGEELYLRSFMNSIPVIKENEAFIRAVLIDRKDHSFIEKWSQLIAKYLKPHTEDQLKERVIAFVTILCVGDILADNLTMTERIGHCVYKESERIYLVKKEFHNQVNEK